MSSLAVARHLASAARASSARSASARGTSARAVLAVPATGPQLLVDRAWLDRELDLVVSAVQRQRPGVPVAELALLTAATAADLAARHPVDGYFPVLVRVALLGLLPER